MWHVSGTWMDPAVNLGGGGSRESGSDLGKEACGDEGTRTPNPCLAKAVVVGCVAERWIAERGLDRLNPVDDRSIPVGCSRQGTPRARLGYSGFAGRRALSRLRTSACAVSAVSCFASAWSASSKPGSARCNSMKSSTTSRARAVAVVRRMKARASSLSRTDGDRRRLSCRLSTARLPFRTPTQ
jgi:hypothetical protein